MSTIEKPSTDSGRLTPKWAEPIADALLVGVWLLAFAAAAATATRYVQWLFEKDQRCSTCLKLFERGK